MRHGKCAWRQRSGGMREILDIDARERGREGMLRLPQCRDHHLAEQSGSGEWFGRAGQRATPLARFLWSVIVPRVRYARVKGRGPFDLPSSQPKRLATVRNSHANSSKAALVSSPLVL